MSTFTRTRPSVFVNTVKIIGTATGKRYRCGSNSIITTSGDENYFPGTTAGTVETGGQYV